MRVRVYAYTYSICICMLIKLCMYIYIFWFCVDRDQSGREAKKKMSEGQKFQLGTVGALSLSVISSVSIVICNKALISSLGFTFGSFFFKKKKIGSLILLLLDLILT